VQKHKLGDFQEEFLRAYPGARVLAADTEDLTGDRKREFVARCATGNPTAIIMSREAFRSIPVSAERMASFLEQETEALRNAVSEAKAGGDRRTVKQLEQELLNSQERWREQLARIGRDRGLSYEDTGIDYLVVDEAQGYRKGPIASSLPGIADPGSQRSLDLLLKLAYHRERYGETRVCLATATPYTNRIAEIYTWQRYLTGEMEDFDAWCRTFGKMATAYEMTAGGEFRAKARLREIINAVDLHLILRELTDFKLKDSLDLPLPEMAGGKPQIVEVPASGELLNYAAEIRHRYAQLGGGPPQKGADNHLKIQGDAIKAALDLRLVGESTAEPQKVDVTAEILHAKWLEHRDDAYFRADGTEHPVRGSLILVFASLGTPGRPRAGPHGDWNFYTELRNQLVARGIPRQGVRFIHEAATAQQKEELFRACRNGEVAILIGSTEKLGTGTNVQDRAVGLVQVTAPWNWDEPHQELGRVERQGNQNKEFWCIRVVTSPSADAIKWERARQKEQSFRALLSGKISGRTIRIPDDDLSSAEVMAAASGDRRLLDRARLEGTLAKLATLRNAWAQDQSALRFKTQQAERLRSSAQAVADQIEATLPRRRDTRGDAFTAVIGGRRFRLRADAGRYLNELLRTETAATPRDGSRTVQLGELGGFGLSATITPAQQNSVALHLDGLPDAPRAITADHRDLPAQHGLITRLENRLAELEKVRDTALSSVRRHAKEVDDARRLTGNPFPQQAEYEDAAARLESLEQSLIAEPESAPQPAESPAEPPAAEPVPDRPPEQPPEDQGQEATVPDQPPAQVSNGPNPDPSDGPHRVEEVPADDTPGTALAPEPQSGESMPADDYGVIIDHGRSGTLVRNTRKGDLQVREALRRHNFSWSPRLGAWYLRRNWSYSTRNARVHALTADLRRIGRPYRMAGRDADPADQRPGTQALGHDDGRAGAAATPDAASPAWSAGQPPPALSPVSSDGPERDGLPPVAASPPPPAGQDDDPPRPDNVRAAQNQPGHSSMPEAVGTTADHVADPGQAEPAEGSDAVASPAQNQATATAGLHTGTPRTGQQPGSSPPTGAPGQAGPPAGTQADGETADAGKADRGETAGPSASPVQDLTADDVAAVLRRLPPSEFSDLVQAAANGTSLRHDATCGHLRSRAAGEPYQGATEQLDISASGIGLTIMTPDGTRQGHVSWPQIVRWIRGGLTPPLADGYAAAYRAAEAFEVYADGFLVLGQGARHADAVGELDTLLRETAGAITSAATAASPPGWPATPMRNRPAGPAGQPTLDIPTDAIMPVQLERISQLLSGLDGPARPGQTAPAAELRAGTAIYHPSRPGLPIVLTADADASGTHITLTGEARSHDQAPQPVHLAFPEGRTPVALVPLPRPASQPPTDDDACRSIARLGPRAIAQLARGDAPDIAGRLSLESGEPDLAGRSAAPGTIMVTSAGLQIEIADTPAREGAVSWPRAQALVRLGLTPIHQQALLKADEALQRLGAARRGFALIGEEAIALRARDDLYAIAEKAAQEVISQSRRENHSRTTGLAPLAAAATGNWQRRALGSAISGQSGAWAVRWIDRVASSLPPVTSYREIPVSSLSAGDVFLRPGGRPDQMLRVMSEPVVTTGAVEVSAAAIGTGAAASVTDTVMWRRVTGREIPVTQVLRLPRSLADLYPQDYQAGIATPAGLNAASPGLAGRPGSPPPAPDPPAPRPDALAAGRDEPQGELAGLAGVLAAIADHRQVRRASSARALGSHHEGFEPIWAAFASLRQELGLPAPGGSPGDPDRAAILPGQRQRPPRSRAEFGARRADDSRWADIRQAFGELRLALDLPPAGTGTAGSPASAGTDQLTAEALRRLDDAMAEAAASARWFVGTAELRRTARITAAAGSLAAAIRESAAEYWTDIRRDVRVRGFLRTVAARACKAIAQSARELARIIARRRRQDSAGWRAAHRLHREAAIAADRLMGYAAPDSGRRMRDVREIISAMPRTGRTASPGHSTPDPSCPAALAGSSFPRPSGCTSAKAGGPGLAAAVPTVHDRTGARIRR
jgi:hypothetical protein